MKTLKFGGTSMANADSIKKVAEIIKSDKDNKFVIVSAPGKREKTDTKVTDLLYACYTEKQVEGSCSLDVVRQRFEDILKGLDLKFDMSEYFDVIENDINDGASKDYVASRGEYLSALVMAKYLKAEFIDSAEFIRFDKRNKFDSELTNEIISTKFKKDAVYVIPGFYGINTKGDIVTFSRGGSDVTGAIVARGVNASVYENWTDVDGFLICDPRIVENPRLIEMLTYRELRELSYMGANVLHSDCIFPVRKQGIPIHIRNTFNPSSKGTLIVPTKMFLAREFSRNDITITGIAGKKGFVSFHMEKSMMNNELGFARRALEVLEKNNVSLEHMPSGIDTLSLIADANELSPNQINVVLSDLTQVCDPDKIDIVENLAMIAVVGHGMSRKKGTASRVFNALYKAGINIIMIDQGSSELNIIVGVENSDYEKAISALYAEFNN